MNNNNFDPLELIRREENERPSEPGEVATVDTREIPPAVKLVIWILLGALVIYLLYAILVHPVDKLKIALALGGSCEISVEHKGPMSRQKVTVKVDGNRFCIEGVGTEGPRYYVTEGNLTYTYKQNADGEWEKVLDSAGSLGSRVLFDRRNYEKSNIGVWELKEGVTYEDYERVELCRSGGKYQITLVNEYTSGNATLYTYDVITFEKIGGVKITVPWE